MQKKKVVVLGGGNGSAAVLVALKQNLNCFDLSAIISVADSGGSSGRLREEFDTLPPGDILRAVLAMSKYDYPLLKQIFYTNRFNNSDKLDKHNLGNLFLVLASEYGGDYLKAIRALEQSVEAVGKVFPATWEKTHLEVRLDNGKIISKEGNIDKPDYDRKLKIMDAWLKPKVKANEEALTEIKRAGYIIFSPGSLYTSVVPVLLTGGIKEAIADSKAKLISVNQINFEGSGETGPESLSERVLATEKFLPRSVDMVIYNKTKLNKKQLAKYREHNWILLKSDPKKLAGRELFGGDFEKNEGGMCALKLGKIFKKILCK